MRAQKAIRQTVLILAGILLCINPIPSALAAGPQTLSLQQQKIGPAINPSKDVSAPGRGDLPLDIGALPEYTLLGPQPEPPDIEGKIKHPAHMTQISPQPEPPSSPSPVENPATKGGINPQPEPPRDYDPRAGTPMPIPPSSPPMAGHAMGAGGVHSPSEPSSIGYFKHLYTPTTSGEGDIIR